MSSSTAKDSPTRSVLPKALARVTRIAVGSKNAPKIQAVRTALTAYWSQLDVQGFEVASGVSEQPVGFREIVHGAETRAHAAWEKLHGEDPQAGILGVGIEDGLVELPGLDLGYLNVGCAVLTDGVRNGYGFSSLFSYPTPCWQEAVEKRAPIGELFDRFWSERNPVSDPLANSAATTKAGEPSALSVGNVGKLSLGVLPRAEYARHAVLCAVIHFLHPDFFEPAPKRYGAAR